MSDTKPQTLGFGVQGLSNISLGTESSAKFMPLVTAVDRDRSNSIDQHQCGYWCGMYYPQLSDNTLDKLAIKRSVYVSDCNKAPELSVMTIIMGTLYAVCWVIRGNTETGKLPKIVKSVCYTVSAPQSLGFSGQGLSNINLGTGYNAKFTPLVTAVDLDRSNSLDKQQSRYLSDNTLDKLAIYVPKLIQYSLTYGVQLTMIILGTLLVKGCDRTPELSIMTIIMGTLYAVCWLIRGKTGKLAKIVKSDYMLDWLAIYGSIYVTDCYAAPELPIMAIIVGAGYAVCWVVYRNTETGKLPQIVKSACYTGTACAFIVLLVGLVRAMCIFTYWRSCSNVLIAPVATFAMIV
ncbi:unnamed protein product, partial [Medioppia subpectinata]